MIALNLFSPVAKAIPSPIRHPERLSERAFWRYCLISRRWFSGARIPFSAISIAHPRNQGARAGAESKNLVYLSVLPTLSSYGIGLGP